MADVDAPRKPMKKREPKPQARASSAPEARRGETDSAATGRGSGAGGGRGGGRGGADASSSSRRGKGGKGGKGGKRGGRGIVGQGKSHAQSKTGAQEGQRPRRPLAELVDYLRSCVRTLEEGLGSASDEELLAMRVVEELGDRVLLIAADQRGSKPLERLLRKAGPEAFGAVFVKLAGGLQELAPNQYASHVLATAFASWAERLAPERGAPPPLQPLADACAALTESGGWPALIDDACASHTVRSLLLALGGYAPEATAQGRAAARAGLLPAKRSETPAEVAACRRGVACAMIRLIREDPSLCLSSRASPVAQLLLRVLRDRGDRALASEAAAAVTGAKQQLGPAAPPSEERCEALLRSPAGSRVLEAVLETASSEAASALFTVFFRPRLGSLVRGESGDFGGFVAQRVLDSLREPAHLEMALRDVDVAACLGDGASLAQQGIAVKLLEACLRMRAGFKQSAGAVFRALGVSTSTEFHRAWPTLLALQRLETIGDLLKSAASNAAAATESGEPASKSSSGLRNLPASGPQILALLLRFPADTVQPLNSGLTKLLANTAVLSSLARDSKTARVIEAALAPASALLPKLRIKLTRSFKGVLGELGPHPVGGWVCAALWRASLGDAALRESFAQELIAVEDALRTRNFAVWKVCGLHQAKTRQEEWTEQQHKAGKTKRLFGDLLEGGEASENAAMAKAAREARERAEDDAAERAALSDPVVSGLLAESDRAADGADEATAAKISTTDASDVENVDGEPEDAELDRVFRSAKRKRKRAADAGDGVETDVPKTAKKNPGGADADLCAALELIAGKAPRKVKKRLLQGKTKS